jgi:hypothetical protein
VKIVRLKGAVLGPKNDLGASFEEQRQGPAGSANIHRLPKPIEH